MDRQGVCSRKIKIVSSIIVSILSVCFNQSHGMFELNPLVGSFAEGLAGRIAIPTDQAEENRASVGFYHFNPFGVEGIDVFGFWFERNIAKRTYLGFSLQSLAVYDYSETLGSVSLKTTVDRLILEPVMKIGFTTFEGEIADLAVIPDICLTIDGGGSGQLLVYLLNPFSLSSLRGHQQIASAIAIGGRFAITRRVGIYNGLEKMVGRRSSIITHIEVVVLNCFGFHVSFRSYPSEFGMGIWLKLGSLDFGFTRLFAFDLGSTDIVITRYRW
ncbi:MAG: hypothetical protein ACUVUU_05285 [bacterium]